MWAVSQLGQGLEWTRTIRAPCSLSELVHLRHWLLLVLTQSIWTGSYLAMKLAGEEMPVGLIVCLRYGLATLVLLLGGAVERAAPA